MSKKMGTVVAGEQTGFRKWVPLVVMGLAVIIIVLDTTLLNVSLGTIVRDLHTSIQSLQWVITAYALTLAALTITGGRFGDLFGRKKMFVLGAIIFAAGSFLASISTNVGTLIVGESIIEGIGAALMMPATASLLIANYTGHDRALALGIWGGMAAIGAAIGPIVGGYLTTNYSWRWGFRINVFVAAVLVIASFLVHDSREPDKGSTLDWLGVFLSAFGLLSGVFSIIEGPTYGWFFKTHPFLIGKTAIALGSISIVPMAVVLSIALLASFVYWEQRMVNRGKSPLVSMKLFKIEQFRDGALLTAVISVGQVGLIFGLPVFLQGVRGYDALHTGYALLPMSVALLIMAPLGGFLSRHFVPKRIIQVGLFISTIGLFYMRATLSVHTTVADLILPVAIYGIGIGLNISQLSNVTLSAVSPNQSGEASGVNNTMRQIGSSLGTAIIGSIIIASVAGGLHHGITHSDVIDSAHRQQIAKVVSAQSSNIEFESTPKTGHSLTAVEQHEIKRIANNSNVAGIKWGLLFTGLVTVLSFLLSIRLPYTRNLELNTSLTPDAESALDISLVPEPIH